MSDEAAKIRVKVDRLTVWYARFLTTMALVFAGLGAYCKWFAPDLNPLERYLLGFTTGLVGVALAVIALALLRMVHRP